jgi:S1-C subfamily serine protease
VVPGSPAEKAGLKAGDLILKFAGQQIDMADALAPLVRLRKVDERVEVVIRRDDQTLTLTVTVGKQK